MGGNVSSAIESLEEIRRSRGSVSLRQKAGYFIGELSKILQEPEQEDLQTYEMPKKIS